MSQESAGSRAVHDALIDAKVKIGVLEERLGRAQVTINRLQHEKTWLLEHSAERMRAEFNALVNKGDFK